MFLQFLNKCIVMCIQKRVFVNLKWVLLNYPFVANEFFQPSFFLEIKPNVDEFLAGLCSKDFHWNAGFGTNISYAHNINFFTTGFKTQELFYCSFLWTGYFLEQLLPVTRIQ